MFSRHWEAATATIVAKKFQESSSTSGTYEYVADVTLASGEMFRTTLSQPHLMSHVVRLREGETVSVFADVRRRRAKFDRDDARVNGKGIDVTGARAFDDALKRPAGTSPD